MSERQIRELNIDVYKNGGRGFDSLIVVDWNWERSVIPLARYCVDIFRGESPEDMKRIAKDLKADVHQKFEDRTAKLIDKHRTYHYKLVVKNKKTGSSYSVGPKTWGGDLDIVGLYVVEEHDFLFRHITGIPCLIYKKHTDGNARCDICWDKVAKRVKVSNCQACHGTGYIGEGVGGYHNPSYVWVDLAPDPEIIKISQWGRVQPTQTDVFMSNYPRLTPGDLLFEVLTNKRWEVVRVRDTEKRRTKMLQISRLDLINKDQVEYTIEVPREIVERARRELNDSKRESEF